MARVLIAAGGTGGHVYPGLVLASVLRDRGHAVTFVGGERVEARLVPEAGFPLRTLPARGLPPESSVPTAAISFARALVGARRLIRELDPAVVVGMGGYHTPAPALAAWRRGLPVVLHEQNAAMTRAQRLALRGARVLALSFPLLGDPPRRAGLAVHRVGNPLRPAIRALAAPGALESRRAGALRAFSLEPGRTTLLATGGSQGALALNRALAAAAVAWHGRSDLQVLHLCGPDHVGEATRGWEGAGFPAHVAGYVESMEDAYACADVVVGRSGASTLAELAALGLPSVLVPLPFGGFQAANAALFERSDAALVVEQKRADFDRALREAVDELVAAPSRRESLAAASRELGMPDAADRLADIVASVIANGDTR